MEWEELVGAEYNSCDILTIFFRFLCRPSIQLSRFALDTKYLVIYGGDCASWNRRARSNLTGQQQQGEQHPGYGQTETLGKRYMLGDAG